MAVREVQKAPQGYVVTVGEPNRTLDQNAAQWPYLEAWASQLEWPVNGAMCKLTANEFKDILTAAFEGESVRLATGLNGGVVMLGLRTSRFGKKKFSEWMEFLKYASATKGIVVYTDENESQKTTP